MIHLGGTTHRFAGALAGAALLLAVSGCTAGSWTATGSMDEVRADHTATLLPDGTMLVAGGSRSYSSRDAMASAQLYDPSSGSWIATGAMIEARQDHTATLLSDGTVLVAGGISSYGGYGQLASAELYDSSTGSWTATGNMSAARIGHTVTLLPDGTVLVTGGSDGPGPLDSAELYDPSNGSWTVTARMDEVRGGHTATLLPDGTVLVAGGSGRSGPAGFFPSSAYEMLASAELYDPSTGSWTATGTMAAARHHHTATLLPDGTVLVAGGSGPGPLDSAELYDPSNGSWTVTARTDEVREGHTATLLPDGTVLVAGGSGADDNHLSSAELYDLGGGT